MTVIQIIKNNKIIMGFSASGHSGYAEEGSDIVCAAISVTLQNACIGILKVLGLKADYRQKKKEATLLLKLSEKNTPGQMEKAQIVLQTMIETLKEIQEQHGSYLKVEEI